MTTIDATQTTSATAATAARPALAADFDMFLKLLTVQMQNQDPLDPMKTSEYTSQLVQYSQVEQSLKQSQTLQEMLGRLDAQDLMQATGLIGREAAFSSPVAGLSDGAARWAFTPDAPVAKAELTISDARGRVVRKVDMGETSGRTAFTWDGVRTDGTAAADGPYQLSVKATDAAGRTVAVGINALGTIRDAAAGPSGVQLGIGGASLALKDLISVAPTTGG